jgi:hypothetical protein
MEYVELFNVSRDVYVTIFSKKAKDCLLIIYDEYDEKDFIWIISYNN